MHLRTKCLLAASLVVMLAHASTRAVAEDGEDPAGFASYGSHGALFTMTDSADPARGNEVVMYDRSKETGDLRLVGYFPTGRRGHLQLGSGPAPTSSVLGPPISLSADGLGSSDSLVLANGNRCLLAVNAGSNTLSSFEVQTHGLELTSVLSSQGGADARFPVSIAISGSLLYALNAGDQGSLVGFRIEPNCVLSQLPRSSRSLRGITDTAQLPEPGDVFTTPGHASFSPDGKRLVIAIKGGPDGLGFFPSGRMAVFPVGRDGTLEPPVTTEFSFAGGTGAPFSLMFLDSETVVVVHANSSTVASYKINRNNTLSLHSDILPSSDVAPCWLDRSGDFVYTASFGGIPLSGAAPDADGVLDGYRINVDGTLSQTGISVRYPSPGVGRSGNHGVDIRIAGKYLYFLQPRIGKVGRYTITKGGFLENLANFGGLPEGAEPFAGLNPGIGDFTEACYMQGSNASPECRLGSVQGIAVY